jgi:hypothetical protein
MATASKNKPKLSISLKSPTDLQQNPQENKTKTNKFINPSIQYT